MMKPLLYLPVGAALAILSSCDKPTSGQNTSEYRDGNSGSTSGTIEKDTGVDSTRNHEDRKDQEAPSR